MLYLYKGLHIWQIFFVFQFFYSSLFLFTCHVVFPAFGSFLERATEAKTTGLDSGVRLSASGSDYVDNASVKQEIAVGKVTLRKPKTSAHANDFQMWRRNQ